ncbi:response regulator transcription factor [Salinicoccus halodurans]|uniref:Transcriptional regulatory protein SrrA n=1 Tax=Salinicoccus halodurans TaxID=407035 RepID=A0A0F7D3V9_9STAP|nr:response regulator transcription factor [Salinicoccus halodurans]AKG73165.1 chemotaxis protein CheY [Salinicoccus halodurans]SFK84580.1 two-component system, OmpR family, alkaline phosphatase synthesis response regulator PhoP [Salinicoccus halodurans]
MRSILVVDDEPSIVTLLKFNLEQSGYSVLTAEDGNTGLDLALTEQPDLIVLDLMLPGMDGMDVCKTLRQEKMNTPILMLTAKDEEFDKILGLELGADDYMTKPFSPREVVARVKAILRRSQVEALAEKAAEEVFSIGDLEIHLDKYDVYYKEELLVLTPKEFELLLYLANHKGKVLSRDQLLNGVWDFHYDGDTRIVDVHISHLREKIEEDSKRPEYIRTIRGFGYKLEGPVE